MNIDKQKWDLKIKPSSNFFYLQYNEVWLYRYLIWLFIKRDFTTLYKQTILGPLWLFLQPLITTIVFSFIFSSVAKISTDGVPPVIFYMSGLIAWNYFAQCLSSTSTVFTSNAGLFSKVYFPRIIIPISKTISSLTKFGIQLLMFLLFYSYRSSFYSTLY